jgi:hypothetical protein
VTDVLDADAVGPVDVAVMVFETGRIDDAVGAAIRDLVETGTVRIIDFAVVRKDSDGDVSLVELDDVESGPTLESLADAQFDLLSEQDLMTIAESLDPGSAALVVVWENTWAAQLAVAVRASGGRLAAFERIPHDAVASAIAALAEA